ncbi:Magnesium and cobalt efflux protein CorC [hydrothermal vent metagenome]|uniref:Magnesium and cobalt efflux protein CorC n=1 Tax=hydrothermal vent metagenome TaxID=652676 RepID=A0A3B0SX66_9ZZZZ
MQMPPSSTPSFWQTIRHWFKRESSGIALDEAAQELVDNALAFDRLRIEDIMVPLADIKAVEVNSRMDKLGAAFIKAGHSRLPVYRGNLDDPVGMVHIKDLLPVLLSDKKTTEKLANITRDVLFVPPSMNADDLLVRMQKTRVHMALVVDEYGGTDGLVTLEDLIEQIVGNIEDEHDTDTLDLRQTGPACWEASARLSIAALETATGAQFRAAEDEDDVETLGGLIFTLLGRIPVVGEVLQHQAGFEFEIKRADPRRIITLLIRKMDDERGSDT